MSKSSTNTARQPVIREYVDPSKFMRDALRKKPSLDQAPLAKQFRQDVLKPGNERYLDAVIKSYVSARYTSTVRSMRSPAERAEAAAERARNRADTEARINAVVVAEEKRFDADLNEMRADIQRAVIANESKLVPPGYKVVKVGRGRNK